MTPPVQRDIVGFWRQAERSPQRTAIVDVDGSPIVYGELLASVNQLSNALEAAGVSLGGRVAVVAWNRCEMMSVALAASQIGATFTFVNAHSAASEITYILDDSRPSVVFVGATTATVVLEACSHATLAHPDIVSFDEHDALVTLAQWVATHPTTPPAIRQAGSAMLYTSGTTGNPKGVQREPLTAAPEESLVPFLALLTRFGIDVAHHAEGDGVHLVTSPLYHAAPLHVALLALHLGHAVVLMDRFDARRSLELIEKNRVTWTHVVPTMMQRWMSLDATVRDGFDLASLRWVVHAAAPCPVDLKRAVLEWLGPVIFEYYSSTEVGGTAIGAEEWLAHPGSVGRAWPGAEVRILDDQHRVLGPGETGDIYMRNIRPFTYHNDPDKTAASRVDDFVTVGDIGWLDEHGYLYIADRRSDLILVGGANVYPAEVEAALRLHPAVGDAAVIGVPDADLGQAVRAIIQLVENVSTDGLEDSLRAHCDTALGSQKRPGAYEFVAELPRTDTGKLLRRVLRERCGRALGSTAGTAPDTSIKMMN